MSRPLIKECELRRQFKTYFTTEELTSIGEKATKAGLPISAFIRESCLGKRIAEVPAIATKQWASLARVGSNLNQIAAKLNRQDQALSSFEWREIYFAIQEAREETEKVRVALTGGGDLECISR